jgi:hypothetical protein
MIVTPIKLEDVSAACIGLSDKDFTRLKTGQPMSVGHKIAQDAKLGVPILIINAPTDAELMARLEKRGLVPEGSTEQIVAMETLVLLKPVIIAMAR